MVPDASAEPLASDLYYWAYRERIAVQHIIYSVNQLEWMLDLIDRKVIVGDRLSLLFPLGRYAADQESDPGKFRMLVTFDEQSDGKTVLTLRQMHPSRERREAGIGFGAVARRTSCKEQRPAGERTEPELERGGAVCR